MQIEFDPVKREKTLKERGLDFARAAEVFEGRHFTAEDARDDYSEPRYITLGKLNGRMVVMVWTPRGQAGCRVPYPLRGISSRQRRIFLIEIGH